MKRHSKTIRQIELYLSLSKLGFETAESANLVRIERALHRWAEAECNGEIQRDETTDTPHRYRDGKLIKAGIPDLEALALKKLEEILSSRNKRESGGGKARRNKRTVLYYHQTDPRGCALYLITHEQLGEDPIDSVYNRGLAVCI